MRAACGSAQSPLPLAPQNAAVTRWTGGTGPPPSKQPQCDRRPGVAQRWGEQTPRACALSKPGTSDKVFPGCVMIEATPHKHQRAPHMRTVTTGYTTHARQCPAPRGGAAAHSATAGAHYSLNRSSIADAIVRGSTPLPQRDTTTPCLLTRNFCKHAHRRGQRASSGEHALSH